MRGKAQFLDTDRRTIALEQTDDDGNTETLFVPDDPGNRHRRFVADMVEAGETIAAPPGEGRALFEGVPEVNVEAATARLEALRRTAEAQRRADAVESAETLIRDRRTR